MSHHTAKITQQFRNTVDQWFNTRVRECFHCRDCGASVSPLDDVCATCGGGSPARISWSAGIVLCGVFVLLLLIAAIGAWLF